jgi:hypothetical protein
MAHQIQGLNTLGLTAVDPSVTSLTNAVYEASGDAISPSLAYDEDNSVLGVCYGDGSNSDYPTVKLATIDDTTLTWGAEVVIESSAISGNTGLAYDTSNNRWVCGGVNASERNAPKVLGASTNTSGSPLIDTLSSLVTIHSPASGKYVGYTPVGNFLIYDPAGGRTLAYFQEDDGVSGENAVLSSITFDDVGIDNTVSASSTQIVEDGSSSWVQDSQYCYDSTANRVVRVGQDKSGTYQITAQVISGTGDTITVNSTDLYLDASIAVHNENHGGSSLDRMRLDNTRKLVHLNGVNHVLFWDDEVDDFVVSNFSVSDGVDGTTASWTESGGEPVRSEGIMSEHTGNLTEGKTSGWGTDDYESFTMGASTGRGRLVIFGPDGSDTNAAVLEYAGGAYTYKGSLLEVHASNMYKHGNALGWQSSDPDGDGFLANHVLMSGQKSDESADGRVHAVAPGAAAGIQEVNGLTVSQIQTINGVALDHTVAPSSTTATNPNFGTGDVEHQSICYDSINNFIVAVYRDEDNSNYATARAASVSGTTLTWGDPVVFHSGGTANMRAVYCPTDGGDASSNVVMIGYSTSTGYNSITAIAATIDDSKVISFGSEETVQAGSSGNYNQGTGMHKIAYNVADEIATIMYIYGAGASDPLTIAAISFSGTSLTVGTPVTVDNSSNAYYGQSYDSSLEKTVITFDDESAIAARVITLSGTPATTITLGDKATFGTASSLTVTDYYGGHLVAYDTSENRHHVLYYDDDASAAKMTYFTASGTDVTWSSGTPATISSGTASGNETGGGIAYNAARNRIITYGATGENTSSDYNFEYHTVNGTGYTSQGDSTPIEDGLQVRSAHVPNLQTNSFHANTTILVFCDMYGGLGGRVYFLDPGA